VPRQVVRRAPPSRVIAPYPTLTDLCFEDFFGYLPVRGYEAEYYDHRSGRVAGGSWAYLRGENTPYNRLLHYRANLILDAVAYVLPWQVFGKEINDSKRVFDRRRTQEVRAYYVSSAGVGKPEVSEKWHRVDVAIAMQNMILAATALGYGSCWIGAFDPERVKEILGLPEAIEVVALTPLGVPADHPDPRPRQPMAEFASVDHYGKKLT